MAAHTHVAIGYDVQIAVDAKHKLIVEQHEQQVTSQVVDMGLLAQTADRMGRGAAPPGALDHPSRTR